MDTKQVTVSGSVGKQVYTSAQRVLLYGYGVYAPTSAADVTIRSGYTSGDIKHQTHGPVDEGNEIIFPGPVRFDLGMHVKVTGVGSIVYLYVG